MNKEIKIDGIEILRFISAFAILIWHYQHFNAPLNSLELKVPQPFFNYFKIFYTHGYMGVNFFWCISGFIFFWKYADIIKKIKFYDFFISRFSRLYPLHIATLIIVLFLQTIYFSINDNYFIVKNNDLYHFLLNLFMASNWGLEKGMSFNGVIWSISIEILVYGLFFIILSFLNKNIFINIFVIIICLVFKITYKHLVHGIVDCALFFFLGGCVVYFLNQKKNVTLIKISILLISVLSYFFFNYFNLNTLNNVSYVVQIIIYPILIFLSCGIHIYNKLASRIVRIMGNLTYSSYLLHFPIQLCIMIYYSQIEKEIPFYNNSFFIFYILTVLISSFYVFKYFENPCKKIIRNKFKV